MLLGKNFSLQFLPATPSSPSQTLEGHFELTWFLQGPSTRLMRCFWMYRESQGKDLMVSGTVRWAALGTEVTGHRQAQLTKTLSVKVFFKNALVFVVLPPSLP